MILLIDNYDSFTYNLYQLIALLYPQIEVIQNDQKSLEEIEQYQAQAFIISPGPKKPKDAGITLKLIHKMKNYPILGVCLGMQAIAEAFGGEVVYAPKCVHGKTSLVYHSHEALFEGIKSPFNAARYHSLMVHPQKIPSALEWTAQTKEGIPMALKHKQLPIWGVQFHPESILSDHGKKLIENFLKLAKVL